MRNCHHGMRFDLIKLIILNIFKCEWCLNTNSPTWIQVASTSELVWHELCLGVSAFRPIFLFCLFQFLFFLFPVFPLFFWSFLAFLFFLRLPFVFLFVFLFVFFSFLDSVSLTFLIWMLGKSCNPNSSWASPVLRRSRVVL